MNIRKLATYIYIVYIFESLSNVCEDSFIPVLVFRKASNNNLEIFLAVNLSHLSFLRILVGRYVFLCFCVCGIIVLHYPTGITLASLLASEKPVTVEAEVKEKRWWLKGTVSVEVATEVIKFLSNMTKVNYVASLINNVHLIHLYFL